MEVEPSEVVKAIKGADFPATREELVLLAEQNDASEEVVDAIRDIDGEHFDGPDEILEALDIGD